MSSGDSKQLTATDAIKTYRYLRIAMIGTVVLLAASIWLEHRKTNCWQTSISGYYYTPVRAIFVGGMITVGFALIVVKGKGWFEDTSLNFAGMFAPVVAVAPTTDIGKLCSSVDPRPLPAEADFISTVNNNFDALLLAGAVGLALALFVAIVVNRNLRPLAEVEKGTKRSLFVTAVFLFMGWWLNGNWTEFYSLAHGYAAVTMFGLLTLAVGGRAFQHRNKSSKSYLIIYSSIALLMAFGGVVIWLFEIGGDYTTFWLEAFEIVLFAAFWSVQTVENWDEEVVASA
ncbi:MAG: hypothetical protein QOH36_199 [Actinomycetota bacterium]|nr:hypothetical protein [Actinomycetota bacterium]